METEGVARSKVLLQSIHLPKACRITITISNDVNSTFTGVLHSIDQTIGKITLKNVSTAGSKLYGPQIYYCKDILDMQVVSDVQEAPDSSPDSSKSKRAKQMYQHRKTQPPHLSRLRNLDDDSLVLSNILRDELVDQGIGSDEDNFEDFYENENYTLICRVCEKFYDAIEYIMNQHAVGVAVNGQKLGRDGVMSLLQIATDSELIIFDILRLGDEAFKAGLQAVFETADVMKVIHDCRWLADLLRCQHNISMANIFDTQVANAFVYRSLNEGDWPRFVESLPGCLISYLNLHPQDVQFTQVRERCKEKDEAVWLVRPLPKKLLEAATKNTVYLLRLQQVLLVEMLAEFKAAVGIYLNYVSGTVKDVEKCRVNSHLLPIAFTYIDKYVKNQQHSYERQDPQCFNRKGFRENNVAVPNNTVVFSHDSPWHKQRQSLGKEFSQSEDLQELKSYSEVSIVPAEERRFSPKKIAQSLCPLQKNEYQNQMFECNESVTFQNQAECEGLKKNCVGDSSGCSDSNKTAHMGEDMAKTASDTQQNSDSLDYTCPNLLNIESAERILESQSFVQPRTQNVGELIKKSGLWKMSVENKEKILLSVSRPQNVETKDNKALSTQCNQNGTGPSIMQTPDISGQDVEQANELKCQMALLDQLHFVPSNPSSLTKNCSPQQKAGLSQERDSSSLSKSCLELTKISRRPASMASSDCLHSRPLYRPTQVDHKRENMLASSALMPAGMQETKSGRSKFKKKHQGCSASTVFDPAATEDSSPEDFSLIPTPQSLTERKEQAFGVSSIGIGNPFSEDEGFSTPRALLKSQIHRDEAISEAELDLLLQSDKSQRILKFAGLKPSTIVRDKILPVQLKMKSPQSGSS